MKKIFAIALLFVIAASSMAFAGGQCPYTSAHAQAKADAAAQTQAPENEATDMNTEKPAETAPV